PVHERSAGDGAAVGAVGRLLQAAPGGAAVSPENEWDATAEPYRLLELMGHRLTMQSARRIAVGYCRTQQSRIVNSRAVDMLDVLEQVVDGTRPEEDLGRQLFRRTLAQPPDVELVQSCLLGARHGLDWRQSIPLYLLQSELRGLDLSPAVA